MREKNAEREGEKMKSKFYNEKYLNYVSGISPKTNEKRSLLHAFWVGGTICVIGQFIRFMLEFFCGLYGDELAGTTSIVLIFIGALLTGLGVYDRIGKYAGGGSIVPITGFANGVASPAVEAAPEGEIFGKGVQIFTIAGPVILYGVFASWLFGLIYWLMHLI